MFGPLLAAITYVDADRGRSYPAALRGRAFTDQDRTDSPPVVVVSRALAERAWPVEDPVGKRIRDLANEPMAYRDEWLTVVGVVGNVRHGGLMEGTRGLRERPPLARPGGYSGSRPCPRACLPPPSWVRLENGSKRSTVTCRAEFSTMSALLMESVADRRFTKLVLAMFAGVAIVLAAVGIYGIIAYMVTRRTREIGLRIAFGGDPGRMVAWMVRKATVLAAVGLVVGVVLAVLGSRLLAGLLDDVGTLDPLTFSLSVVGLLGIALLAAWLPARRAARVDPMIALRAE